MIVCRHILTALIVALALGFLPLEPGQGALADESDEIVATIETADATPSVTVAEPATATPNVELTAAPTQEATATVSTVTALPTPIENDVTPSEEPSPSPATTATRTPVVMAVATGTPAPPRVSLSVGSGQVGQTIRVQVDNFPGGKRIAIYFEGSRKTTIVTASNGRARGSFVVPTVAGGAHEIKANGGGTFAVTSFTVVPEIVLSPTSAAAGSSLFTRLTGFPANSTLKIRLYDLDGSTVVSVWSTTTNSTGGGSLSLKTKFATQPGSHLVRAVGSGGVRSQSSVTITARSATIETDILNLRAEASTSGRILTQMLHGETVQIVSISGEWAQVTYNGRRGWALGSYLAFGRDSASFWVPTHQQQHSLSCEYASLQIATSALGNEIPEDEFIPVVGLDNNPHYGFRGNIDGGYIFGTDDYGVYPEPLADALPEFGFTGEIFYGGTSTLKSHLRAGHPVVVWIDLGYTTSFTMMIDGEPVTMAPRSHVVVAYGYSDEGVLISDPDSSTRKRLIPWADFNVMWSSMDQMALAVSK